MMKSYLRFEPEKVYGIIASPQCNISYDFSGNLAITGALQGLNVWNIRQASQVANIQVENPGYPYSSTGESRILLRCDKSTIAVGYSKGDIRIFDYFTKALLTTLRGHRASISSFAYGKTGKLLASGSADCDIIVWDLVSYTGICKLRGHKDMVTGLSFIMINPQSTIDETSTSGSEQQYLVSVSKDSLLKVWDYSTNHCVQTVVGHRSEIWSVTSQQLEDGDVRVLTGSADELIRGYRLKPRGSSSTSTSPSSSSEETGFEPLVEGEEDILEYYGSIRRSVSGSDHCGSLSLSPNGSLLAAASTGRNVEIFRLRNSTEAKKKHKRRLKRIREKAEANDPSKSGKAGSMNDDGWLATDPSIFSSTTTSSSNPDDNKDKESGLNMEQILLSDEIESQSLITTAQKVRGFAFSPVLTRDGGCRAILSTLDNLLEVYQFPPAAVSGDSGASAEGEEVKPSKISVIELHGHRSDVRAVCLSSDGLYSATCSSDGVKVWSSKSNTCIRSCNSGYSVSLAFSHGSRYTISGTKEGGIQLLDTVSGNITVDIPPIGGSSSDSCTGSTLQGHAGAVWALDVRPDGKGFMTGSADKLIKFWDFTIEDGALGLKLSRQLEMTHDVLCLKYNQTKSQDRLLLAAGLLDNTIKIFYDDSLRFFLSLYGHKLPVMCLDMSYDSTILVSGSADKTIKIWGLDFGDCHRSLHAHEDSVTCLRFQPDTHYFFSGGKDGVIKYWDADRFEQVLYLPGHVGAVWGLTIAFDGSFLLSSGQDRSLRVWARTDDLVFVEEEKERALEAEVEKAAARSDDPNHGLQGEKLLGAPTEGLTGGMNAPVSLPSTETVKGGEMLMDALDLVERELGEMMDRLSVIQTRNAIKEASVDNISTQQPNKKGKLSTSPSSTTSSSITPSAGQEETRKWTSSNPLMLGLTPHMYMIRSLRMIKAPDMEQALLVMPFHYIARFVPILLQLISRGLEVELCTRCVLTLLKVHFSQIISTQSLLPHMQSLQSILTQASNQYCGILGTNLAALKYLSKSIESKKQAKLGFGDGFDGENDTFFGGVGSWKLNSETKSEGKKKESGKSKKRQITH